MKKFFSLNDYYLFIYQLAYSLKQVCCDEVALHFNGILMAPQWQKLNFQGKRAKAANTVTYGKSSNFPVQVLNKRV